jgi:hypothetical protein
MYYVVDLVVYYVRVLRSSPRRVQYVVPRRVLHYVVLRSSPRLVPHTVRSPRRVVLALRSRTT